MANPIKKQTETAQNFKNKPLLIREAEGIATTFANCCCPVPGDAIVGFLNEGYGLDIHTGDCANLVKLRKQPEKCLPVHWADDVSGNFRVALSVKIIHQRGAMAELTKATSEANASIDDISISERSGGYCLVSLHLLIKNLSHLERVLRHIGKLSIVIGVIRKKGS